MKMTLISQMCSLLFSYSSYWIITPMFLECLGSTEGNDCLDQAVLCDTGSLQPVKLKRFRLALHLASAFRRAWNCIMANIIFFFFWTYIQLH